MSAYEDINHEVLDATELGYIRTILARERTYLVFLRTLSMFAGLTILIKQKMIQRPRLRVGIRHRIWVSKTIIRRYQCSQ